MNPRVFFASFAMLVHGLFWLTGCDEEAGLDRQLGQLRHPERLDFGRVPVGLGRAIRFDLENVGTFPVRVLSTQAEGTDVAEVTVRPERFTVEPRSSVEVTVRFRPLRPSDLFHEVPLRIQTDLRTEDPIRTITLVGRGVRQGLALDPNPVRFGRVVRGRTVTRTATLSSLVPESVDVRLARIETTLGRGRFELLSPLAPLDAGERVPLRFRYTPFELGPPGLNRASAIFTFCPSAECEFEARLEGEALVDALRCQPDPVDFGVVRPDRRRAKFTLCENRSLRPTRLLGATIADGSDPEFTTPDREAVILPPGGSETIQVRLEVPADGPIGPRSGVLSVRSEDVEDEATLPPLAVNLSARVGGPALQVRPVAVDFGRVAVGSVGRARIGVSNIGDGVLFVTGATTSAPFGVQAVDLQVASGESEFIEVSFQPQTEGAQAGRLALRTNAPEMSEVEVPLGGIGLRLEPCEYRFEPRQVDFGALVFLRSTTRGLQIRNVGQNPCLIREATIAAGSSPSFRLLEGGETDALLQPGEAWTFVIGFRPERLGLLTGTMTLQVSDPRNPTASVSLRGNGFSSTLVLDPDEVDFGELSPGCAGVQTVLVHNPSDRPVPIARVALVTDGPGPSPFVVEGLPASVTSPGGSGLVLGPREQLSFRVRFLPTADGERAIARVEVDSGGSSETVAVALYGRSTTDPFIEDRWLQAGLTSVDILLVIDNSTSMSAEQSALQASFPRFIRYAEERNLDYRIAAISTDVEGEGFCNSAAGMPHPDAPRGACGFFSSGSEALRDPAWRIVDPGESPSPEIAFTNIADLGIGGSAAESGLAAAVLALDPARLSGWNAGFLARPDAFFGVVFLSDEDDQSPGDARLYEAALAAARGERFRDRYALNGIVVDGIGCGGGSSPGSGRYLDSIRRSGGTIGSICQENYDETIDRIARAAVGLRERFVLRRPAFSPSVEVIVDRVPLSAVSNGKERWRYEVDINAVVFRPETAPREGAEIVIRYRPRCFPP